jgi:hypothetical protein
VLLHELAHVEAGQRGLVVEEELGERLGELGLADARRPQKQEAADGLARVPQAHSAAADRLGDRQHRVVLADDALLQLVLHPEELGGLLLHHLRDRDAGPRGDHVRHVLRRHHVVDHHLRGLVLRALGRFGELLLEERDRAEAELSRAAVVAARPDLLELALGGGELLLQRADVTDPLELALPALAHLVDARLQILGLGFELLAGGDRVGVVVVEQALGLDLDRLEPPAEPVELGRLALHLHPHAGGGLVDQVHRALRQLHPRDVAPREGRRGDQRGVADAHPVVDLEAADHPAEHRDRLVDGRRVDRDPDEAPGEDRVLVVGLADRVRARDGDRPHLTPLQRRRDQLACARRLVHQRAQIRQEEDDRPRRVADRVQDGAGPLFELTPQRGAGHQRPHLEADDPLADQHLRHVADRDPLRQPLDDRRLADARLADEQRVVLAPAREHLEHAAQLRVATDGRVEPALGRESRQVAAELLDRVPDLVLALLLPRRRVVRLAHRRALDRRAEHRGAQPALAEHVLDPTGGLLGAGLQQVPHADGDPARSRGLALGAAEQVEHPR